MVQHRFIVDDSFWRLFPDAAIGIVVVHAMKQADEIQQADKETITQLLASANQQARRWLTSDTISQNEPVALWRDAYQRFKTKKGARCSIEALLKRVLKNNPVGSITPSVDIYNAISLKYAVPVGGEDVDTFRGDMHLTVTDGGDAFVPIGSKENDPTLPGEVCYKDEVGAICRCWNWRDGQRTKLTDTTKNAVLLIECADASKLEDTDAAIHELADLLKRYCGATIDSVTMVARDNPSVDLT